MPDVQKRSDARANRDRILEVAVPLLRGDPDATVDEVAAAAGVSRATVYRHFSTRPDLVSAVRAHSAVLAESNVSDSLRPAGELASSGPLPLDIADVLNKVPPHLLGEQIVAEAQRLGGIRSVAIYLIDIDGTRLQRLAGSLEFPQEIEIPLAIGPEIPREAVPALRERLSELFPASVTAPMFLRGRALGVLLAVDAPEAPLLELARQAGAALALADEYTDVFDAVRRRKDITAASEVQQAMLPPRVARISGGMLAGNVLPGYEIGGDWFDYVENPDGAWIGVADAAGSGTLAAAIGAITLGAFRAKRRRGGTLGETVLYMESVLLELNDRLEDAYCNAIVARWHGPSGLFFWISCGDQQPFLVSGGKVTQLRGTTYASLGLAEGTREVKADSHRLQRDERILLISDGVLNRRDQQGAVLGLEGIQAQVAELREPTAPALVWAIERAMIDAHTDPLEDDATIVVFAPTDS